MAQVAGGSHSPVKFFPPLLSDESLFSDELFANFLNCADNDECTKALSENIVGSATTSSADIHRTASLPLSKLTEGVDGSPNTIEQQSQQVSATVVPQKLDSIKSRSLTSPLASSAEWSVSKPSIKLSPSSASQPPTKHSRRQSSLRNEYQPTQQIITGSEPSQTLRHKALDLKPWSEQSANAHQAQQFPTAYAMLPMREFEQPFSLNGHALSFEESSERSSVNRRQSANITHNNTTPYSPHVSSEQYIPKSTASHFQATPIHGLPGTCSLPNNIPGSLHIQNPHYQISPPSCTNSGTLSATTPLASPLQLHTPPLSSHAANKYSNAPMQLKHEHFPPLSRSLPQTPEMTVLESRRSPCIPLPRRQTTTVARRNVTADKTYVEALVAAMKDMTETEDNPGMLDTWQKMMKEKKVKIERVCKDILETIHKAHDEKPEPLGEKRPIYVYDNFKQRFDAVCIALRTQKTICKHLLEDPYVYQVVDDPVHALKRVQNNRRVNQQKKEAIDEGRKRLGLKGQGKGVALRHAPLSEDQSDLDEEDQDSGGQPPSEQGSEYIAPSKSQRPRRAATKRAYVAIDGDEGDGQTTDYSPKAKKTKPQTRTSHPSTGETIIKPFTAQDSDGSDSNQHSSSPLNTSKITYAHAPAYHPRHSTFSTINPNSHYHHEYMHGRNGPGRVYSYNNGFPASTYDSMRPMIPNHTPSYYNDLGMHNYPSHVPVAYNAEVGTDDADHNIHDEAFYDPMSN